MKSLERARGKARAPVLRPKHGQGTSNVKYWHDTAFDVQLGFLCAVKDPIGYEPTHRGVAKALCMSRETLHRYQIGATVPLRIVYEDTRELLNRGFFDDCFWDDVAEFKVCLVERWMEETDRKELAYEITFNNTSFFVRRFAITDNRLFREVLWKHTDLYTPPIESYEWKRILNQAMNGGYSGNDPSDPAELEEFWSRPYDD